jgi:integrase
MTLVRGHNEGSIFWRKSDRHKVAQVTMPDRSRPTLACPHKHRPSDRDCPEAKANLAELLRLRDHGAPPGGHTLTLGRYLQRWLEHARTRVAPATYRKHESIIRVHITPALGHRLVSELSVADVRDFLDRRAGLDPQTQRHHRATLRRALADALRDGLTTRNVAALAEPPKMSKADRPILTAAQARVLMDGTTDDPTHAVWVLACTTGMRLAEMLALTWDDVDLEAGTVTIDATLQRVDGEWQRRTTKTAKSRRTVSLTPRAIAALRPKRRLHGLVFTTAKGMPLHGSNLPKILHAHTDRLGLPRVTIHDLRHSAATILYANGADIESIADMLGHSTSRITADLYRHRVTEMQRDLAVRMHEAIG